MRATRRFDAFSQYALIYFLYVRKQWNWRYSCQEKRLEDCARSARDARRTTMTSRQRPLVRQPRPPLPSPSHLEWRKRPRRRRPNLRNRRQPRQSCQSRQRTPPRPRRHNPRFPKSLRRRRRPPHPLPRMRPRPRLRHQPHQQPATQQPKARLWRIPHRHRLRIRLNRPVEQTPSKLRQARRPQQLRHRPLLPAACPQRRLPWMPSQR